MSRQKIVILILSIISLASGIFLPWGLEHYCQELIPVSGSTPMEYGPGGNGKVVLILAYLFPLIACLRNKEKDLIRAPLFLSIIPPFIMSIVMIYDLNFEANYIKCTGWLEIYPAFWFCIKKGR